MHAKVAWCAQGQACAARLHGDVWLALAPRRQSKTVKRTFKETGRLHPRVTINMVNRDGALCPCLKINIKKLAAEPNAEPIQSLPPSPTEHAPRTEESPCGEQWGLEWLEGDRTEGAR